MKKNILIVASGTGGHVIPAKNISEKLAQRGYSVTWIGTKSGIENLILKDESYKIIYINSTGIRGKRIWEIIKGLTNTVRSIFHSLLIIKREKPIFVLGFGGYITVPVSIAAFIMRVPVYVHESNSVPGTANKINKIL